MHRLNQKIKIITYTILLLRKCFLTRNSNYYIPYQSNFFKVFIERRLVGYVQIFSMNAHFRHFLCCNSPYSFHRFGIRVKTSSVSGIQSILNMMVILGMLHVMRKIKPQKFKINKGKRSLLSINIENLVAVYNHFIPNGIEHF